MDPIPTWKPYHNRRGKVKGVAIVFRASDIGLELKDSGLWQEGDRQALCEEIAEALNKAFRPRATSPQDCEHD